MTIQYNHLNLPRRITFSNGAWMEMLYDAAGRKWQQTTSTAGARHYIGGVEYVGGGIESLPMPAGRVYNAGTAAVPSWRYEYALQDHLGNSRALFTDADDNGQPELQSEYHYYPFGMKQQGWTGGSGSNYRYQYNGKELTHELGLDWYDYGARWYDAALGRWNAVDPLGEKYLGWSPYNYVMGNPVRLVDPDGRSVKGDYYGWNGKYLGNDGEADDKVYVADGVKNGQFTNAKDLGVTKSEFSDIVGTVYSEMDATGYTWKEGAAIYDVMETRAAMATQATRATVSVLDIAATTGVYGFSERGQILKPNVNVEKLTTALSATINAMFHNNSNLDWSNGATMWQGEDLGGLAYYKTLGITFTSEAHNVLGLESNPKNHSLNGTAFTNYYETTAGYGRTTFMKRTAESLNAAYPSYPNIPTKNLDNIW